MKSVKSKSLIAGMLFSLNLLFLTGSVLSQSTTRYPGNWTTNGNWYGGTPNSNENASIQHHMILNTNITINNGTYTVTESGSITDLAGGQARSIVVGNNGMLDVDGNVTIEGNFEAGVIRVRERDTLIVGDAEFIPSSNITIDEFGVLIVNGDLDVNASFLQATTINCNGLLYVNGDISASSGILGSVSITGTGKVQATGNVSGSGWPSPNFFGNNNVGCTSGCEYGSGAGLPIELLSFSANHTEEGKVKIEWVTETEINNDHFIVEQSRDGYIFKEIARLDGAGNSINRRNYEVSTESVPVVTYYRLTQVDYDGSSRSFAPVALEASEVFHTNEWLVYPNPIRKNGSLKIYLKKIEENSRIEIRDISGKLILEKEMQTNLEDIRLDQRFKNGIYIVTLISDNRVQTQKLIVGQ